MDEEILLEFRRTYRSAIQRSLAQACEEMRDALVGQMLGEIERLGIRGVNAFDGGGTESSHGDWVAIESLSKLRSVVGGRYANLKRKWMEAGLPLRLHRGDRSGKPQVNGVGWVELSNWIRLQGFEARLSPDDPANLFEVRPISAAG